MVETLREEMFVIWTQHGVSVVQHQQSSPADYLQSPLGVLYW